MNVLQIPNQIEMLFVLQSFVEESAKAYKLPKSLLARLRLVSEEAFLYTVKNSFEQDEFSTIKITITIDNFYFRLSFFDKGLPLDRSLVKEYSINKEVDSLFTEGMELFLIKEYADNVEWVNLGHEGKEFKLSFKIPHNDIFTILKSEAKTEKPSPVNIKNIEIRKFRESDAVKISRTIYRAYGYTYPNEDMYYPEKIVKLNESGQLISVVCYDKEHDEIVGHYALERPHLGAIAESGQAVVSPKYRGFNFMKKMRVLLEQEATNLTLEGIMSQPVTTHTYSQKVNIGFGSFPCGFSLGLVPQKLHFRQINKSLSQRESCLLFFKPFKKRIRTISIPKKHKNMIEKIYTGLDLEYKNAQIQQQKTDKNSIVQSNYYSDWGFGVITVDNPEENSGFEVKQSLYNLLYTMKADVIFLYISIEDNNIEKLVDFIEREKFFFCGISPSLLHGKDVIRFQYLNGSIDSSKFKICTENAQEIVDYTLREKERVLQ